MKTLITFLLLLCSIQTAHSQTWTQKLPGIGMWSLTKDFAGNVYAGCSGTVKSIYKSTDGGNNWTEVFSGGTANILGLACDSSNNVYACYGSSGLLKSTNGGANFTIIPSSTFNSKTVSSVGCGKNGYVYVGCTVGGVFRSTDYGATFPDNPINTLTIVTLAAGRFNSNIIYAGASSGTPPNYGFYRSTDAGLTFSSDLNSVNIWGIAQKTNGNLYTITTSSGYPFDKSTNGGLNWTTVSNFSGAMRGLCMDLSENFYAAGNGGVWKSTNDGVSFTNFGMTFSSNQTISFQNKILVAASGTSNGGVWIYTDSLLGVNSNNNSLPNNFVLYQNYPNPFNPITIIKFSIPPSKGARGMITRLVIYDVLGRETAILINEGLKPGTYQVEFNAENLPSGIYFYQLTIGNEQSAIVQSITKKMVLIK
jgi:hypothetical protein